MAGRSDRRFCSDRCSQRHHRSSVTASGRPDQATIAELARTAGLPDHLITAIVALNADDPETLIGRWAETLRIGEQRTRRIREQVKAHPEGFFTCEDGGRRDRR